MHPAIFLDRDGVIIENRVEYIRSWSDVHIYPQALTALARISKSPYKIIIVTNQSAVGRGLLSPQAAQEINERLIEIIKQAGGRVDGIYLCPHAPEDQCSCRKPKPGLLTQAARELSLDLGQSIIIGDALSDVLAGQTAGLAKTILVKTGRGASEASAVSDSFLEGMLIYDTLADALADLF